MRPRVIIVSPEAAPFAKTGGLADVAGSLPKALKKLGCEVSIFMPYYRQVAQSGLKLETTGIDITVPLWKRKIKAEVLMYGGGDVPVYFIKQDELYDRSYLYGTPEGDYFDNLERYAFFSRGVLEALKEGGFTPDVIHCNDWQTGLLPAYLKDAYKGEPCFQRTAVVFTIHNIAYQGLFDARLFELTNLSPAFFNPEGLEFWGKVNLLKSGLVYSEIITTVSRAYSAEIQTPEYGYGLEGVLQRRKDNLYGVLNGIDYEEWNPEADPMIPANYSRDDMRGKRPCRRKLLKGFGLKLKPEVPLIGIISRLAAQKGFDILSEAMPELMELDLGIVLLGSGDRKYRELMEGLAERYPEKLAVKIDFNNALSHLVEAGSDMFLMPSRYEPCGLNQIYSLRYGTIPVVRATGGLEDTVRDYKEGDGTGFKFKEYSAKAIVEKVKEAIAVFEDKKAWEELQKRAMAEDFSWERSARKYMELYQKAEKCLKLNQASLKNTHTRILK
ncbi:MAG: glycogen synthase GlgA [Deltaproteobacteria bacterium]|nr:glycogen synthase GlgA [Deltaproteobacteria bacterium]